MPVAMPIPDEAVLTRRREIVRALRTMVPAEGVIQLHLGLGNQAQGFLTLGRWLVAHLSILPPSFCNP